MQVGPYSRICANRFGLYCVRYQDNDVIMSAMASQITSLTIVYSTVYSGADQRKHQSSASLAFVRGIHRWPLNSSHKWSVTQNVFPFDEVIMIRHPICLFSFRVTSLGLGHLYGCPSSSETPQKNMGKRIHEPSRNPEYNHNKTKHNKTICTFYGTKYMFSPISTKTAKVRYLADMLGC